MKFQNLVLIVISFFFYNQLHLIGILITNIFYFYKCTKKYLSAVGTNQLDFFLSIHFIRHELSITSDLKLNDVITDNGKFHNIDV